MFEKNFSFSWFSNVILISIIKKLQDLSLYDKLNTSLRPLLISYFLIGFYNEKTLSFLTSDSTSYFTWKSECVLSCCSSYNSPSYILSNLNSPINMRPLYNRALPNPFLNLCCNLFESNDQSLTLVFFFDESKLKYDSYVSKQV